MDDTLIFSGIVASTLVKIVQSQYKLTTAQTSFFVIVVAIFFGLVYNVLHWYGLWDSFFQVYVTAGATYAFIFRNLEKV